MKTRHYPDPTNFLDYLSEKEDPDRCCYCGDSIKGKSYVGAGTGSGQRYSCQPCWNTREIIYLKGQFRLHGEALLKLIRADVLDRMKLCETADAMLRIGGGRQGNPNQERRAR